MAMASWEWPCCVSLQWSDGILVGFEALLFQGNQRDEPYRIVLMRLNSRSHGTYLQFPSSIFSWIPLVSSQLLSNSLFEYLLIIVHTHIHIYNNTLWSVSVTAHVSMCLIVTTWDQITSQETHLWRALVLPQLPSTACSSLSEGQGVAPCEVSQPRWHVSFQALFRQPSLRFRCCSFPVIADTVFSRHTGTLAL